MDPPAPSRGSAAALLLADGRFPAGGHAHSGGIEAAVAAGRVHDADSLAVFLEGRLWTSGLTGAGLAAAACARRWPWAELDAEAEARTASPALRAASRRLGRQALRTGLGLWPGSLLVEVSAALPAPHHPVALGALAAAAGLEPLDAARLAGFESIAGPAAAALRLLGLDPVLVHATLARLCPAVDGVAEQAAEVAAGAPSMADLPCPAAPLLEISAEDHAHWEVRLFAS